MPDEHLSAALARIEEHQRLHLPLPKTDVVGRAALRMLWNRHLKWQMEVNIATAAALQRLTTLYEDLAAATSADGSGSNLDGLRAQVDAVRADLMSNTDNLRAHVEASRADLMGKADNLRDHVRDVRDDVTDVRDELTRVVAEVARISADVDQLRSEWSVLRHEPERLTNIVAALSATIDELDPKVDSSRKDIDELQVKIAALTTGLNQRVYSLVGGLRTELSDQRMRLSERDTTGDSLADRVGDLERTVRELTELARDSRIRNAQLDVLIDRHRRDSGAVTEREEPAAFTDTAPDRSDFVELACCTLVEGPFDAVRTQRAGYLPVIEKARAGGATGPVFDARPGRGEWFEVLRDAHVDYRGASTNQLIVNACADLGATVAPEDPIRRLAAAAPRTLGAVTAFRYVERLTPGELAEFVDLAALALQPGGVLIVESPYGAGLEDFHLDPFARRPVHPSLLRFLVERTGLHSIEIGYPEAGVLSAMPADLTADYSERAVQFSLIARR